MRNEVRDSRPISMTENHVYLKTLQKVIEQYLHDKPRLFSTMTSGRCLVQSLFIAVPARQWHLQISS